MLLKNLHHKNWYHIMRVAMAIAYNFKDEVEFYLNTNAISEYLTASGVKVSQRQVSECIQKMCEAGYIDFLCQKNLNFGEVHKGTKKYYQLSNIYRFPDFGAIDADLYQYSLKYPQLDLFAWEYTKYPQRLIDEVFTPFSIFCVEVRRDTSKRDKELDILRAHKVHQQYEALVAKCNAFVNDEFFHIEYAGDDKLRATNGLCSTKNPERHLDKTDAFYGDLVRLEKISNLFETKPVKDTVIDASILEQYGLEEIDVKASIYRLTYNLTHDDFLDPSVDLYEEFYNKTSLKDIKGFRDDVSSVWFEVTGKKEHMTVRDIVKELSMPLYMGANGRVKVCDWYCNRWTLAVELNKPISAKERDRYNTFKSLEMIFGISIYEIVEEWYSAMKRTLGIVRTMRNQIFWYESDLYIAMLYEFRSRGIACVNVYDGFYFVKGSISNEEFYRVYTECLNKIKAQIAEYCPKEIEKMLGNTKKEVRQKAETTPIYTEVVVEKPTTKKSYCEGLPLLGMSNLPVMQKVKNWV